MNAPLPASNKEPDGFKTKGASLVLQRTAGWRHQTGPLPLAAARSGLFPLIVCANVANLRAR